MRKECKICFEGKHVTNKQNNKRRDNSNNDHDEEPLYLLRRLHFFSNKLFSLRSEVGHGAFLPISGADLQTLIKIDIVREAFKKKTSIKSENGIKGGGVSDLNHFLK